MQLKTALVEQAVMGAAYQDQVVSAGGPAMDPVLDVVGMHVEAVGAPRKAAAAVARPQRPPQGRRDRPRAAAHVDGLALLAGGRS